MKKISKIVLENFRTYLGKKEISFLNHDNEPADFVCIYGKNGFGKTSLFDGFEWFFTGEIHLLGKELNSNVSKYEGYILKNRYASVEEKAGVRIEYTDGTSGRRTIRKLSKSIKNDYGKGNPGGECKGVVNEKQILPHSKIDSFVYAKKPKEKYNEWGNFWDPDNSAREHFQAIYEVFRSIEKENGEYSNKIQGLLDEQTELNVSQKIKDYNEALSEFNNLKLRNIGKLNPLQFNIHEKVDMDNFLECEKIIEPLQNIITENTYLSKLCDYLEEKFEDYIKFIQRKEKIQNRRVRWIGILKKCNEKKDLLEQKERISIQKTDYEKDRDNIANRFDEQWFLSYQRVSEDKEKCRKLEEKIQSDSLAKQNLHDSMEVLRDKNKSYAFRLKNLSNNYDSWLQQIKELELREASILNGVSSDSLNKLKEEADAKKQKEEKELGYLKRAFKQNYESFAQSLNEEELLQYSWIKQFLAKIQAAKKSLTDQMELEIAAKDQYEKVKKETENIDELLALARNVIEKKHTKICPVCRNPFDTMENLLNKIDLSEQQEILNALKLKWNAQKEESNKASEALECECSNVKKDVENMILEHEKSIMELSEKSEKYRKEIKEKADNLQELKDNKEKLKLKICETMNTEISDLTKLIVKQMFENRVNEIGLMIRESVNSLNTQQKEMERLERILEKNKLSLAISKKSKEDFYQKSNNIINIEILEKRNLSSFEDCQEIIRENETRIAKAESEINKILDELELYKIYKTDNIQKYELFLKSLEVQDYDWINEFEKERNHVFGKKIITYKTIKKYNKKFKKNAESAQKKINILDKYLSNLSMKDCLRKHNNLIEEVQKMQLDQKFSDCKRKIADEIFSSAKVQLEEHIKEVFGGTTISHIYEKIEPHKRFVRLKYQISFDIDGKPELYIKALGEEKDDEIIPELFFSSAQLNTVALSVFLGGALSAANPKLNTIFIDDPIGHFDDLNVLSFIDVIRTIVSETDWQIIISTHEENFYELMKIKLDSRYYNSKFFVFKDVGVIVEDR